jgi:PAS domain S-box-containing protein
MYNPSFSSHSITMNHRDAFLANGGAAGARMQAQDWTAHPLGPMTGWPASLRMSLGMVLGSSFPTFLAWGDELFVFHNDAYTPMLGAKSSDAIGKPLARLWPEVWDTMAPLARRVLDGEALFFENFQLTVERHGYPEQAWFTFSYSPLRDEAGAIRGLLCTVVEDTDKVLALARHKEAEERYALSLAASGNIGTWSYELDTGKTVVDEQFARLFQVDAALARAGTELVRFTDMIHPDDRPRVVAAIEHAIATDTLYDIEYRIPQLSRPDTWVNARGKVFQDVTTGRRRFAGVAVDITERKNAELARQESERLALEASQRELDNRRRLDAILDAAPVGIVYIDAAGRVLHVNAANRRIWGDHPNTEKVDDYGQWKAWWPAGTPKAGQPFANEDWPGSRVLAGEDVAGATAEIEPFGAAGTRRTILIRAAAIRNEHGQIIGAVGANMDITAQVEAERAMKDSEAKFRSIANVIPQMVWSAPTTGGNDYLNSRWSEFTGVPEAQCTGHGWRDHVHPDDLPVLLAAWGNSRDNGAVFEVEHRLIHHTGQYRWVLNRALPVIDDSGVVVRWMGTLTDIHDKKRGEEELKAAARRKDEFLAMLAHELRNPLAPIRAAAEMMGMAQLDATRSRRVSEIIGRQVRHMTALIDDLLDVSRVTRGLVEISKTPQEVPAIVANAVEQVRPLIESQRHRLVLKPDPAGGRVLGDEKRLVQILTNLLNNAAKYTPAGGAITLSTEVEPDHVNIIVSDTGIGIAPALRAHVFDLFAQAERTPDRSQGGLGLGLALVKSMVELHGGRVACHSEGLGKGSTFIVQLPRLPDGGGTQDAGPAAAAPQGRAGQLDILVVDDNADAAFMLKILLEQWGHRVRVEHDALRALDSAAGQAPDVALLDIGLPGLDGNGLAQRLRANPDTAGIVLVAVTGYGQELDRQRALAAGFDHHLVKPVNTAELAAVLDRVAALTKKS